MELDFNVSGFQNALIIEVGNDDREANNNEVYKFVHDHVKSGDAESCVVVLSWKNNDDFGRYLRTLSDVMGSYTEIYQDRTRELFGKDFYQTTKAESNKVREGIPANIYIPSKGG